MKKALFITLAVLVSFQSYAQQELLGEHWNLHYMVIDGITHDVPQPQAGNIFYHPGIEFFDSPVAYDVVAGVHAEYNYYSDFDPPTHIDATTFTVQAPGVTLGDCGQYCDLEFKYLSAILFGDGPRTMDYEIIEEANGDRTLIITTPEGNIAVHGNNILSTNEFDKSSIRFFPNPVVDILTIENKSVVKLDSIHLYDLLGELVLSKYDDLQNIDVSSLESGLYFLTFKSEQGTLTKKIIKV